MDLGIANRHAIICASSRGLGFACADALAREGVHVTINGRDADTLAAAAARLTGRHSVTITSVVGDITEPATRDALLDACPSPDILVNNNGGPTPGRFADWDRDAWIAALDANMLAPLAMIRAVLDGMVERQFGRIVNITSAMVKTPLSPMGLSTGARTGLTSVAKALSKDVARANVTINNLLPERIDTERQRQMAELHASLANITVEEAYVHMAKSIAAGRLGRPEELGDACAFLCSAQAGYISGQNLQLDGGSFSGLM
ncbi:MAG: SDR family oxidoreductase [Actinobacteria bacterium]|nr:SDR family oxidoreductase [Actinomycetota bacterium]